MTAPDSGPPLIPATTPPPARGRALAGAIAVYLGGYLVLLALNGQVVQAAMALTAGGRPTPMIPVEFAVLSVLQFLFALAVTAAGILLPRGPLGLRLAGVAIAVIGPILTLLLLGGYLSGGLRIGPLGDPAASVVFRSLVINPWFHTVLLLGIAWLLARRARWGWLSLLGTLVLIPVPSLFTLGGLGGGVSTIVMLALSAVVGAGIVLAGRPWRELR